MNVKPKWAEKLKMDDASWASLLEQSENEQRTALDKAFDLGLLNENKLLEWDRQKSGLPTLKAVFFNGEPPKDIWAQFPYEVYRKHACLPIGNWDGHIYIAKLFSETVHPENLPSNVVWVLAPWTGVKKWFGLWEQMNQQNAQAVEAAPLEVPEGLSLNLDTTSSSVTSSQASISSLSDFNTPQSQEPAVNLDAPAGLNLDFSGIGLATGGAQQAQTSPAVPAQQHKLPAEPQAQAQPPPMPYTPEAQNHVGQKFLEKWQNYFDKTMILNVSGAEIITANWNGSWKSELVQGAKVPLNTPSIFKIVNDTARPYHGYVAPGAINDLFFKMANNGLYPGHVTVLPVVSNKRVVAMIFGSCTQEQGKTLSLQKLEEDVNQFSKEWLSVAQHQLRAG